MDTLNGPSAMVDFHERVQMWLDIFARMGIPVQVHYSLLPASGQPLATIRVEKGYSL